MNQVHVEPPPIRLIKVKYYGKSDKYLVKLKLYRDNTSSAWDLYEFRMTFFYKGKPEEFLFSMRNFNMILEAFGKLEMGAKVQYLHMLVCGEALYQFYSLSSDI